MTQNASKIFDQWRRGSEHRFPSDYIDDRLLREQKKHAGLTTATNQSLLQRIELSKQIIRIVKLSGWYPTGRRNAANVVVKQTRLAINNLPSAFEGYRILHISDPHFNGDHTANENLLAAIESVEYDLCVLTGDYRFRSFGPIETAMAGVMDVMNVVTSEAIAVLGNHDSLLMVPQMEAMGINVLINEHCKISNQSENITVVGVDDPSYYRKNNLPQAIKEAALNTDDCSILLAHSPDIYQQASEFGINAYLCGHTHGGQICLPGGIPIRSNTTAPRWSIAGQWRYEGLSGYTSVGIGTSIVDVRFYCPPEICVHELVAAD